MAGLTVALHPKTFFSNEINAGPASRPCPFTGYAGCMLIVPASEFRVARPPPSKRIRHTNAPASMPESSAESVCSEWRVYSRRKKACSAPTEGVVGVCGVKDALVTSPTSATMRAVSMRVWLYLQGDLAQTPVVANARHDDHVRVYSGSLTITLDDGGRTQVGIPGMFQGGWEALALCCLFVMV